MTDAFPLVDSLWSGNVVIGAEAEDRVEAYVAVAEKARKAGWATHIVAPNPDATSALLPRVRSLAQPRGLTVRTAPSIRAAAPPREADLTVGCVSDLAAAYLADTMMLLPEEGLLGRQDLILVDRADEVLVDGRFASVGTARGELLDRIQYLDFLARYRVVAGACEAISADAADRLAQAIGNENVVRLHLASDRYRLSLRHMKRTRPQPSPDQWGNSLHASEASQRIRATEHREHLLSDVVTLVGQMRVVDRWLDSLEAMRPAGDVLREKVAKIIPSVATTNLGSDLMRDFRNQASDALAARHGQLGAPAMQALGREAVRRVMAAEWQKHLHFLDDLHERPFDDLADYVTVTNTAFTDMIRRVEEDVLGYLIQAEPLT